MKIAVIGAGFTGLTAAYRLLQKGHNVSLFEKDRSPGGLALGFREKGWDWTLEEYYHHWFTNDKAILSLARELSFPVIIKRPKTSSFIDGSIYQLDSPMTLLTFSKLRFLDRIRMAGVLAMLRFDPFWKPLEKITAAAFLPKTMGEKAYEILWKPLLKGKFGVYADTISLAWFWARISKRTTSLAYPEGGFLSFALTLANTIEKLGGTIHYNSSIDQIKQEGEHVSVGRYGTFDDVIVTLPTFTFLKLCPQLPQSYREKLSPLKGLGAIVMVLRLRESFFTDRTYWLNMCISNSPFLAVVEHTNFIDKKHYNNEHIIYVGNYLPPDHPYFSLSNDTLLKTFDPVLKKINRTYRASIIGTEVFKVPFAQPIIPVNYSRMIPRFTTPLSRVFLANMQQVYPWDRGTNYAVELGEKIANILSV